MDYIKSIKGVVEKSEILSKGLEKVMHLKEQYLDQTYELNSRKYVVKNLLAEGGYGYVFLVKDSELGKPYALKKMNVQDKNRMNAAKNEIKIMQALARSEHIVRLFAHKTTIISPREGEVLLLMEFCSGGSLLDALNQRIDNKLSVHSPFTEKQALDIFWEVCLGVSELHNNSPPIIHRDLKLENVLLQDSTWKICDFGSATTKTYLPTNERERSEAEDDISKNTTLQYRSPEMVDLFRGQLINQKVDIWALGCLLFKLAFSMDPFGEGSLAIMNCRYTVPEFHRFSPEFLDLIKFMFEVDPSARPDIFQVLERTAKMRKISYTKPPTKSAQNPLQQTRTTTPSQSQPQPQPQTRSQPQPQSQTQSQSQVPRPQIAVAPSRPAEPTMTTSKSANALFDMLDWQADPHSNAPTPNYSKGTSAASTQPQARPSSQTPTPQISKPNNINAQDSPDLFHFDDAPIKTHKTQEEIVFDPFANSNNNNNNNSAPLTTVSSVLPKTATTPKPDPSFHVSKSSNALFDMLDWQESQDKTQVSQKLVTPPITRSDKYPANSNSNPLSSNPNNSGPSQPPQTQHSFDPFEKKPSANNDVSSLEADFFHSMTPLSAASSNTVQYQPPVQQQQQQQYKSPTFPQQQYQSPLQQQQQYNKSPPFQQQQQQQQQQFQQSYNNPTPIIPQYSSPIQSQYNSQPYKQPFFYNTNSGVVSSPSNNNNNNKVNNSSGSIDDFDPLSPSSSSAKAPTTPTTQNQTNSNLLDLLQ